VETQNLKIIETTSQLTVLVKITISTMGLSFSRTSLPLTAVVLFLLVGDARSRPFGVTFSAASPSRQQQALSTVSSSTVVFHHCTTLRGGADATTEEASLDEKVYAAMRKLGMKPPTDDDGDDSIVGTGEATECTDGVCSIPTKTTTTTAATTDSQDPIALANRLASELGVDASLAMAAVGATATMDSDNNTRVLSESAAKQMIQQELELIDNIPSDAPHVMTLVEEGHDAFLARRALVYAENDIDDARAILLADLEDAQAEEELQQQKIADEIELANVTPDLVQVKGGDFDPTQLSTPSSTTASSSSSSTATASSSTQTDNNNNSNGLRSAASKESVVFEATTSQIQNLVLESPVPVLLDIYADWCGPCKVLGPALEDMAVKAGGMFRLVKVNSDNERPVSDALEVTALPTVFGIRNGKIVHMFQGMPKSEDMLKNFMMGLFGAADFSPPVTSSELEKYEELTNKLIKTAGAASFSFASRERLNDRISSKLDDLVNDETVGDVEGAASLIRTLLNNIVRHPFESKFRTIKLDNKVIVAKLGTDNASVLAVLRSVGFARQSPTELVLGSGKKVINVAPLVVARDCIDNWIQRNRAEMAAAARKRKDELDRARLSAEREAAVYEDDNDEDELEDEKYDDPTICTLKLRLDGKKKVHEVTLHQDDPLSKVLEALNINMNDNKDEEVQITCVAKRLVVKSTDGDSMRMTLNDHGLMPSAALVIKVGSTSAEASATATPTETSSLKGRAAGRKERKKGSHTMQSIGIYAKDDNNKAELIDGGGGALYEHDVSDDEEEEGQEDENQNADGDSDNGTDE
jgi:thiol-disulfide isomerase/thioredoxin